MPVGEMVCDSSDVKNEPMFFNCSPEFAIENGGPITRAFFDALPDFVLKEKKCVFDSRVHMLMPGWYPAIPGYHHDDIERGPDGQPDYDNMTYESHHIMALVNADVCPTKFALGVCEMPTVPTGEVIYKHWHDEIVRLLNNKELCWDVAEDKQLTHFSCYTFHTAEKAVKNGWRWFGRLSWDTSRVERITNEIRKQVQVYLEFPTQGW